MHFEQPIYKWLNKLCGLYSNNAAINCADCHLGWMTFVEFLEWFPMMDLYQTLVARPHCVQPSQCRSWGKNPWVATTITATKLMFAAEMLRHFAAEIWNSLCNLICSSSYKTWKCCNKLKFTIPRFRRRFCFFLVNSCKDCWRFLSLLLELFFSSSAFFWHFYNKSAISNLYLLWIGSSVYWPQDLKSIPLLMYDWWPLMFNKEGSK